MEERRRYKRLELKVNVQLERIDEEDGVTMVRFVTVDVQDISRGGLGFTAKQELKEHTFYNAEIQIWTKETIHVVMEIVRCEKSEDGLNHYGAVFIALGEEDALKIDIYQMFHEAGVME